MNSLSLQYIEDFNNHTFEICKMFRRFQGNNYLVLVQSVDDKHKTFESDKEMATNELRKNRKKIYFCVSHTDNPYIDHYHWSHYRKSCYIDYWYFCIVVQFTMYFLFRL